MTDAASLRVRAKFRLHHAILIDHLVRAREQRRRYVKAEHLGRYQINNGIELDRLLNRQGSAPFCLTAAAHN